MKLGGRPFPRRLRPAPRRGARHGVAGDVRRSDREQRPVLGRAGRGRQCRSLPASATRGTVRHYRKPRQRRSCSRWSSWAGCSPAACSRRREHAERKLSWREEAAGYVALFSKDTLAGMPTDAQPGSSICSGWRRRSALICRARRSPIRRCRFKARSSCSSKASRWPRSPIFTATTRRSRSASSSHPIPPRPPAEEKRHGLNSCIGSRAAMASCARQDAGAGAAADLRDVPGAAVLSAPAAHSAADAEMGAVPSARCKDLKLRASFMRHSRVTESLRPASIGPKLENERAQPYRKLNGVFSSINRASWRRSIRWKRRNSSARRKFFWKAIMRTGRTSFSRA